MIGWRDEFALKALSDFVEWIEKKRRNGLHICALLGNHDLCYFRGMEGPGTQVGVMNEIAKTASAFEFDGGN